MDEHIYSSQISIGLYTIRLFIFHVTLFLALQLLLVFTVLNAQENLPSGEKILGKYVEATGGKEAYEKIHNRVVVGAFGVPQAGHQVSVTTYSARPNKKYVRIDYETMGTIEKGSNGEFAWEKTPMGGPRLLVGQEKDEFLLGATFDPLVNWETVYKKVECTGTDDIEGRQCYKVVMTPFSKNLQTFFFDTDSFLLVKSETSFSLETGDVTSESYGYNYKEVDRILIAHTSKTLTMGQEMIMTIESIKHNVKFEIDPFTLPEEIKELINKK